MEVMTYKKCLAIKRPDGIRMRSLDKFTMPALLRCTVSRNFKRPYLATYGDEEYITYGKFNVMVQNAMAFMVEKGMHPQQRIALVGESCPNWMIAYFATTCMDCIAVPILPDFSAKEMNMILDHCGAEAVVVNCKQVEKVLPYLKQHPDVPLVRLDDLFYIPKNVRGEIMGRKDFCESPGIDLSRFKHSRKLDEQISALQVEEEDLASIIYTSGTTGTSKGVMLTHRNLLSNADEGSYKFVKIHPGYTLLSILPVSHVYEFTIGQLVLMMNGGKVCFLGKPPAPSILMPALAKIRPRIILSVPLLMEKVYRSAVLPAIQGNKLLAMLMRHRLTRRTVSKVIGRKLMITFGGRVKFFGLGGAPLDPEVEKFLYDARFPYALGYGMTETSPLIAGCKPKHSDHKLGTIGKLVTYVSVKFDQVDPKTGIGEIMVKGPNLMKGYYKRDDLNAEVFTENGYFRTGDLGIMKGNRLCLRGRSKTMILGAGGENIYPESIENLLNNMEFVQESLVVPDGAGLMALIKLDLEAYAAIKKLSYNDAKVAAAEYVNKLKRDVNKELNSFSRLNSAKVQEEPFQRTPTLKIKRFLYTHKQEEKNKDDDNGHTKT
jgi:long-chain acyl-CoA synthetase